MAQKFNTGNFNAEVLQSEEPVLVDFYADWCGPCRMMGPLVEQLAETYNGKVKVGKINVDEDGALAGNYG
ncbi:MAG: thioredoxin, partial [Butyrivibrio sp.]|nr:thioredoxin [Butyrivibrio sp.]